MIFVVLRLCDILNVFADALPTFEVYVIPRLLITILLLDTLVVIPILVPAMIVRVDVLVEAVSVLPLATITG